MLPVEVEMAPFEGLCKVYVAGQCNDPNVVSIQLTNGIPADSDAEVFSELWFTAPSGKEREFLVDKI